MNYNFLHCSECYFWPCILGYVIWAFIIICWCIGYFWLFKKTKQIENKKDRLRYALPRGISVLLFPLISWPVIACFGGPLDKARDTIELFYAILAKNHILNLIFFFAPLIMLILCFVGWVYAWFWLFKQTKQIEKTKDRFIYALWRAIFLPTFPLILIVCALGFDTIVGLLFGFFIILIGFVCWSKPPLVTYEDDKTFKHRLAIAVFLMLISCCYFYLIVFETSSIVTC